MRTSLSEELAALQEQLARAREADPDLLTLLSRVIHDVTTLTHETQAALTDETQAIGRGKLHARLEAEVVRFESDHPQIAAAMRRVTDALADLGI